MLLYEEENEDKRVYQKIKNYGFHPLKKKKNNNSNDYIDCTNNNFV